MTRPPLLNQAPKINLPQLREQIGHYDCDDEQPGVRTVEIQAVSVLALIDTAEAAQGLLALLATGAWKSLDDQSRQKQIEYLAAALTRFDFGDTT